MSFIGYLVTVEYVNFELNQGISRALQITFS